MPLFADESTGKGASWEMLLKSSLWLGVLLVSSYHVGMHLFSLTQSLPMGSWETVYAAIARVWPHQYQWENWMDGHDGYGPGYPCFVRPFLITGLDVYVAHRLAGLLALILVCALVAGLMLRNGVDRLTTAVFIVLFHALHAGSYSIQARPDFLVAFGIAAMLALGESVASGRRRPGWGFGVLLGLVALLSFFTKAYSAFSWAAVLCHGFLFGDRRGTLQTFIASGAILAAGIACFAWANPLYVFEVYGGQKVQADPSFWWLLEQLKDFGLLAGGLLFAGLTAGIYVIKSWILSRKRSGTAFSPERVRRYWTWHAVIAALGLLAGPAWHTGAYLTYFLHLLLVPLVMLGALGSTAPVAPALRPLLQLTLLANLAVLLHFAPAWPGKDPGWEALQRDVLEEKGRVAVDFLLEPLTRRRGDLLLLGNGQSGYIIQEPFRMKEPSSTVLRARGEAERYLAEQRLRLFGPQPVEVLYLDCVITRPADGKDGRIAVLPRNQLPFLQGPEMARYRVEKKFTIRPFYFATNAPRQEAGVATTLILKFVRQP